jgi:hypothetical protein
MPVTEQRPPVERVLDVAVYAPIGLALAVCDHLPELHLRRQAVVNRVRFARFIGELAVKYGKAEFERQLAERQASDAELLEVPDTPAPAEPMTPHVAPVAPSTADVDAPAATSLPIGNYESLAAIHVVERLSSLRPDEIESIRRFESAHRARRTILAKIDQLQSTDDG